MKKELYISVVGRVQGVNFRRRVSKLAEQLRLTGFVRNLDDGSVEIIAQGEEQALDELLSWCQKGYFPAKVEGMHFEWKAINKQFKNFKIKKDDSFLVDEAKSLVNLGKDLLNVNKEEINLPKHVVIIPDGNRRWAREKGWKPWVGHYKAVEGERVAETIYECKELGIKYLTFWALSTENIVTRDKVEIEAIFQIVRKMFEPLKSLMIKEKVRAKHIGRKDRLPKDVLEMLNDLEESTKEFNDLNFQLCLDYGGADEIQRAIKKMVDAGEKDFSDEIIRNYLDTKGLPDPDLIIRTAGEKRTSGFMPYQSSYAELYFTNVYFPDFDREQFRRAILDYSARTRRFGGTDKKDIKHVIAKKLVDPTKLLGLK